METLVPLMPSLGERSQKVMQTQKNGGTTLYCFRSFFRNMNSREDKVPYTWASSRRKFFNLLLARGHSGRPF